MTDTTTNTLIPWLLVATILCATLFVALLGMAYAYWLSSQSLHHAKKQLDLISGVNATSVAHYATTLGYYRHILNSSGGGIGKRISECREIAETVIRHAPELFKTEPSLIYWLEATDQVLVALFEIDREWYDPHQERCAASKSALIYQDIHDKSGLPPPRGCVITSSGVHFNDGD